MKWKWGDVWYNLVSHSFSHFSKKDVFFFLLLHISFVCFYIYSFYQVSFDSSFEDYVFQWIRLTFDIQSQFIFIGQIYLGIQSRSILTFLKSKIELQVTYVNSICIHDLGKYEQGLKHSNTFYQQFFDTCCWKWILSVLQFP